MSRVRSALALLLSGYANRNVMTLAERRLTSLEPAYKKERFGVGEVVLSLVATSSARTAKSKIVSIAALLVFAGSCGAYAADVPARQVFFDPSAPPTTFAPSFPAARSTSVFVTPPPPVFDWTGFYLGLNAGYAFDSRTTYAQSAAGPLAIAGIAAGSVPAFYATRASGFTGGGQIGFNKQLDPTLVPLLGKVGAAPLLGLEADAAYTGLSAFGTALGAGGVVATTLHSRTEFVGTARGRLGLAFDRLLVYGTGGFAYGGVDQAAQIAVAGFPAASGSRGGLRSGYAYGGGLAYAFPATPLFKAFMSPAVTIKVEYIRYDLGSSTFAVRDGLGGGAYTVRTHDGGTIVRAGADYKFDLKIPKPPY